MPVGLGHSSSKPKVLYLREEMPTKELSILILKG